MRGAKQCAAKKPRVRATLLVLLWFWGATMFLVVDLFLDVPEFDRLRPRAPLYQAMRVVAHEMVGEPISDDGIAVREVGGSRLAAQPRTTGVGSSRHPGGIPDLRTPQGARLYEGLRRAAGRTDDPAKREGALRSLAAMFGAEARPALLEVASDATQPAAVRDLATRLATSAAAQERPAQARVRMMPLPGPVRQSQASGSK